MQQKMNQIINWLSLCIAVVIGSCAPTNTSVSQSIITSSNSEDLLYIDKNKPGKTPLLFAPGFISTEAESEFGSVFSKDGKSFYYAVDKDGHAEIRYTQLENGEWTTPVTIISDDKYGYNDPFLSPDESQLYYISNQPLSPTDTIADIDIWYSNFENGKWSEPINAGDVINSEKNEYYISFTQDGSMYFSSNHAASEGRSHDFDIYKSALVDGVFQEPKILGDSINTGRYEADVFIAPDESYIIYCKQRTKGYRGDLYISFKKSDGSWTDAKNMGETINSKNHELCPFVTRDGKYLFYTSNQDIYWVSAEVIEDLRE